MRRFATLVAATPARLSTAAVPSVATMANPNSASRRAGRRIPRLSQPPQRGGYIRSRNMFQAGASLERCSLPAWVMRNCLLTPLSPQSSVL